MVHISAGWVEPATTPIRLVAARPGAAAWIAAHRPYPGHRGRTRATPGHPHTPPAATETARGSKGLPRKGLPH